MQALHFYIASHDAWCLISPKLAVWTTVVCSLLIIKERTTRAYVYISIAALVSNADMVSDASRSIAQVLNFLPILLLLVPVTP